MQSGKLLARFFFGGADFFSAKRLFFRAARDVSGERSAPPWARVEIKLKMSFQALSHSPSHERASALTSPPPTFCSFPYHNAHHTHNAHIPTSPPNPSSIHQVESIQSVGSIGSIGSFGSIASIHPKSEHSLLVLPTASAILNFATEFFEMLTKKQSEHPQTVFQVFQVFRVFQVFHFAFGPQNSPILVQIRTNPTNRRNHPTAI